MSFEDTNIYLRWFGMLIIKPALLENLLPLSLLSLGFSTAGAASVYLKRILWTSFFGSCPSLFDKSIFFLKCQLSGSCNAVFRKSGNRQILKNCFLTDVTHYWVSGCPSTYWYKDWFETNVPLLMTVLRQILAIFSKYVCSSFTKMRFRRSFWV